MALKFSSKAGVLKIRFEHRLEASQMKFLMNLLGVTKLDEQRNLSVRDKLGIQNIVWKIQRYQQKWQQHLHRMNKTGIPKQALQYKLGGPGSVVSIVTGYGLDGPGIESRWG